MPWKARNPVDLRMEFVTRRRKGERMSDLCSEFGISRKTGHKIWNRFKDVGLEGLLDASRAPRRIPHKTPDELVELVLAERKKHPSWGPRKLKSIIESTGVLLPSAATLYTLLCKHGLVERKKTRLRAPPRPTKLRMTSAPNEVWSADYKGQFRLGCGQYCYPLTVTDHFSRFILGCEAMSAISDEAARECFVALFREHGLPTAIRTDNGPPFASTALATLTRLSVLWLRLGIELERIEPGHPEQNGRHERMHRTLKQETTRPAADNLLQQQGRFDDFVAEFNRERPHEALDMKRPADFFLPSTRSMPDRVQEPAYPLHDDVLKVDEKGGIRIFKGKRVFLCLPLKGELVGIREEGDGRFLVTFMSLDLGHANAEGTKFVALAS
jgi:transposase InsO family protein